VESIIDILSQGRDREAQTSKIYGLVVGLVTNNKDPNKLGRIKVKFPWLSEDVESWWARICYPMAGPKRGFWFIPEVDDEVLVGFEHGDVRFPYIVGSLYNGVDIPPIIHDITNTYAGTDYTDPGGDYAKGGGNFKLPASGRDWNEDGKDDLRFIRTRSGHIFAFDDKAGEESITLTDKTGKHSISISCKDKRIYINSADGDVHITADKNVILGAGENVILHAKKNIESHAEKDWDSHVAGDYKLKVDKTMDENIGKSVVRKAGTSIMIQAGTTWDSKSGTNMTMKAGANGTFDISAMGTVKSGGILTIMGSLVKIN
jgi:uncharacterized protein involved in type VI secretion and phage assembly